jgi:hypothetical protein
VPGLVYLTSALRELAKISGDIEDASQSREVAITFIDKLTDYCERLGRLPGLLGRARQFSSDISMRRPRARSWRSSITYMAREISKLSSTATTATANGRF